VFWKRTEGNPETSAGAGENQLIENDASAGSPTPSDMYSSDDPADISTDVLGRSAFAERIAETLQNRASASSLVVGLYGPWG
jgi:hypothetical protein